MKNYIIENFGNITQFKNTCIRDLSHLIGQPVETNYGQGTVLTLTDSTTTNDILISIQVDSEIRKYALLRATETKNISFSDEDNNFILYISNFIQTLSKYLIEKERREQKEREVYLAELKKLEEQRELERKEKEKEEKKKLRFEQNKKNLLEKVEQLSETSLDKVNDYYIGLGYITKHAKKISAVMPEYLDNWFKTNFGNQEHKLVDSTKMTSGGFSYQWSLGMTIDLDTNDNIPNYLVNYLGQTKKTIQPISNTEFIFGLMSDSGLVFGKEQNLDKVLENVPTDCLDSFNYGYSL